MLLLRAHHHVLGLAQLSERGSAHRETSNGINRNQSNQSSGCVLHGEIIQDMEWLLSATGHGEEQRSSCASSPPKCNTDVLRPGNVNEFSRGVSLILNMMSLGNLLCMEKHTTKHLPGTYNQPRALWHDIKVDIYSFNDYRSLLY